MIALVLLSTFILASPSTASQSSTGQTANSQSPTRYSLRTILPYGFSRAGSESLPVQVVSAGGGKLGPREKFKILVSMLRNTSAKNVTAVKVSCFIFKSSDWDKLLASTQTSPIPVNLPAFEQRRVQILAGYVDDIPLLAYKAGEEFHLEVAVTEVHYDDGSIWQATDLPQKRIPSDKASIQSTH